jgi:hypothetical protein
MEPGDLDKLRRLGLTGKTASGQETVRVTAQHRKSLLGQSREQRRAILEGWQQEIGRMLAPHGGEIVPNSLSVAGQTVEAVVPVEKLDKIEHDLTKGDVRLDLIVPRQATVKP